MYLLFVITKCFHRPQEVEDFSCRLGEVSRRSHKGTPDLLVSSMQVDIAWAWPVRALQCRWTVVGFSHLTSLVWKVYN